MSCDVEEHRPWSTPEAVGLLFQELLKNVGSTGVIALWVDADGKLIGWSDYRRVELVAESTSCLVEEASPKGAEAVFLSLHDPLDSLDQYSAWGIASAVNRQLNERDIRLVDVFVTTQKAWRSLRLEGWQHPR